MIPRESNGRPPALSRAQPSPSELLLSPGKSDGDSSHKFSTSTQAREACEANSSRDVQSQGKARPSQNAHARKEQERRDGEKELYDKIPEIVNKFGVKMKVSENKKFVTKCSKLEALIECIDIVDARVNRAEDDLQKVMEELQKVKEKLRISDAKAKQSESKAQKCWRKLKRLRSQVRSLSSDGAGDTEWDWCDDDQTLIGRCSSHDSDFGRSIRPSQSGGQLAKS